MELEMLPQLDSAPEITGFDLSQVEETVVRRISSREFLGTEILSISERVKPWTEIKGLHWACEEMEIAWHLWHIWREGRASWDLAGKWCRAWPNASNENASRQFQPSEMFWRSKERTEQEQLTKDFRVSAPRWGSACRDLATEEQIHSSILEGLCSIVLNQWLHAVPSY